MVPTPLLTVRVLTAPAVFVSHSLSALLVSPALQNYQLTPIGVPQWRHVVLDREQVGP